MKQKTRWHDALVLAAVLCAAFLIVTGTQQITGRIDGVASMVFVLAVFLIGAIIFYMHFIMNTGQTIETLQKLVAGNGYEITADCAMTFEPSDQLKPVTDLAQELLNTDSLTAKFTAAGESAQKNLKLQLKENITDKQTALTTY